MFELSVVAKLETENEPRYESQKRNANRSRRTEGRRGTVGALKLAVTRKFVAQVDGHVRGFARESELALEKAPELDLRVRSCASSATCEGYPSNTLALARAGDGMRLVLTAATDADAKKWRDLVRAELVY